MENIKIFRETVLPGSLEPAAIYFIAPAGSPTLLEIIVTDAAGTSARHVINKSDIQDLIDASMASAGVSNAVFVADIAARDALTPSSNIFAYVTDATGDGTVASGGATYLYNTNASAWVKISEWESMDFSVAWANIQNKPASTVADIDDAVSKRHTHANKTQLDQIGENANGDLTYNGAQPHVAWDSVAW